jgi:hypothetical protein
MCRLLAQGLQAQQQPWQQQGLEAAAQLSGASSSSSSRQEHACLAAHQTARV